MNDRIIEMAIEAGFNPVNCTGSNVPLFEKFAALIIGECMRMCEVTEMSFVTHGCDVEASGAITVKQFIAEHFGVEE